MKPWHSETLFLVGAVAAFLGTERQVPAAVARDAYARSTDLVRWSNRHKLTGLSATYAAALDLPHGDIAMAYRRQTLAAMRNASLAAEIFDVLSEAGCRPLLIKGSVLALLTQDDVAGRGVGDVDVVVAAEYLPRALDSLVSAGATVVTSPQVSWRFHAVNLRWRDTAIDLHHRIDHSPVVGVEVARLWERRQQVELAGRPVDTLSTTDSAVFLARSAGSDAWSQLGSLRDFGTLLAMAGQEVDEVADEWRVAPALRLARAMLRRLQPELGDQGVVAEGAARQAWLWTAQGRQLRVDQDLASRVSREVFRVVTTQDPAYTVWAAKRNLLRPWDPMRDWQPA